MTTRADSTNRQVQWAAKLDHVREVSLLGTAELAWWKDRLAAEELVPAEKDGSAQILIVAAEGKFMWLTFRELSFSVLVAGPNDDPEQPGSFLAKAFNSRRFFAFCERVFFSTPYDYGNVRLSASMPAAVELVMAGKVAFRAAMGGTSAAAGESARRAQDGWEGPVYLPSNRPANTRRKWFFARIAGETFAHPFLPDDDMLAIQPSPMCPILQMLLDSQFSATQWAVRADALHAKSKTYAKT